MEVNAYNQNYVVNKANNKDKTLTAKEDSSLGMDDFLNLLIAQMTNQDSMNPMENTEFVAQLAQFSSLQAMSNLADISEQSQATSLIGKTVIVANYNNNGELVKKEGIVEKVTLHSGNTNLYIDGEAYEMSNVMEIKADKADDSGVKFLETVVGILDKLSSKDSSEAETGN